MSPITATRPIQTLVNTHANGDHCYGNQLVADAEIIATRACLEEFEEIPASMMAALVAADFGDPVVNDYLRGAFSPFDFSGIVASPPTRTFSDRLEPHGRRPHNRVDRRWTGPHPGRPHRPRARCKGCLHRRHPVRLRHTDRLGWPSRQLDPAPAT